MKMKATVLLLVVTYTASTVVDAQCEVYVNQSMQMSPNYTCVVGDNTSTPLGFQCVQMTYPELTTDINKYPCRTVENVAGRHIEVLIEPVNPIAQVRTCIREDGFTEQCTSGLNNYCKRIQTGGSSTIIRIYCLSGGCEMTDLLLWFRIELSPPGEDAENWCLTRSQATPSSLSNVQQPIDQNFNFDQDGNEVERGSFGVLQPISVATLFLIVMLTKFMF